MLKKILFCCIVFLGISCFLESVAYAKWQIKYDAAANKTLHLGGNTLRGNFATEQACRNYWASRGGYERKHSKCVQTGAQSTGAYGGTGNLSQDIAGQFFGTMFQSIFNPPAQAPVDNAANARALELEKQENQKKWQEYQAKQKAQQQAQAAAKKKQGEELFSEMDTFSSGNSLGQGLFDSQNVKCEGGVCSLEMQSMSAGKYDTSSLSVIDRLRAANYFSQKALEAMSRGDDESARHFSLQAQKVMSGEMVDEKYNLSSLPNVPEPPAPTMVEEKRQGFSSYNAYLKNDINIKLKRVDKAKKQIKEQKKKAEKDISKFEDKSRKTKSPEEKQKYDKLVRKAKQALEDAKNNTKKIEEIKQGLIKQQKGLVPEQDKGDRE